MFNPKKSDLNMQMRRDKLIVRTKAGLYYMLKDNRRQIIMTIFVVIDLVIWLLKDFIWNTPMFPPLGKIGGTIFCLAITEAGIVGLLFTFGHPFEAEEVEIKLVRAGLVNSVGESPMFLYKEVLSQEDKKYLFVFSSEGVPLKQWKDSQESVENALNIYISEIRLKDSKQTIEVYAVDGDFRFQDIIPWEENLLSEDESELLIGVSPLGKVTYSLNVYPHMLIGGTTGSGKTVLLKVLLHQCIQKNYEVVIADFKGGVDFNEAWSKEALILMNKAAVISKLEDIISELERRKELFRSRMRKNIQEFNVYDSGGLQRIVFACDEIAELLDKNGLLKEEKQEVEKIEKYLSTIARQGRAFGIHLFVATQRPDATILTGQIKNNIDYRVCGRADNVLSQIILDNTDAASQIPKDDLGMFLNQNGLLFKSYMLEERQ